MSSPPQDPSVVLCHATGFCGAVLRPLAEHAGLVHYAAPDLRGHGDAPLAPDDDLSWSGWADDALASLDTHIGAQGSSTRPGAFGFGHSGGGAALLLAEHKQPGTFRGLYLYEPVVMPPEIATEISAAIAAAAESNDPSESNRLSGNAARRRAVFPSREAAFENYAGKPPMDVFDPAALHAYVECGFADLSDGSVTLKCKPENEARMYAMAPNSGAWDALARVQCPVVIARGRDGTGLPADMADRIATAIPAATVARFDHLGHFGPMEAPGELGAAFRHFIDRCLAGSKG